MTDRSGEDSPTDSNENIGVCSQEVESVSPNVFPLDRRGGRDEVVHEFTALEAGVENAVEEDVAPMIEEGADVHRDALEAPVQDRDNDGAVHFGGAGGEARAVRLRPGVPVPSQDMVRRHRRAGYCPYRPWCAHCVSGAANAPAHVAREPVAADGAPEAHCDHTFFRDQPKDVEHTVTVLVCKDRLSSGISADVVPKKGAGGGFAVKQLERNTRKSGNHGKVVLRSDG